MKTVLIAGGAGEHGGAIARRLVADGWFAILADLDGPTAGIVADRLGAAHADATELDVTDMDAIHSTVDALVATHGTIDALVNAAGGRFGSDEGSFAESDPATWHEIIDLQLRGMINVTYAVLPAMIAAGHGGIVSLAAFEGLRGDPDAALFSAAKAGVIVLSEMLVREVQPYGIRVNSIVPGNPQSLERLGRSDDATAVANAVAFLLSDASELTTGACLDVSGGWALH